MHCGISEVVKTCYAFRPLDVKRYSPRLFPGHSSHEIVVIQRKARHRLRLRLLLLSLAALAYPLQDVLTVLHRVSVQLCSIPIMSLPCRA
jgi:hypothetical protein